MVPRDRSGSCAYCHAMMVNVQQHQKSCKENPVKEVVHCDICGQRFDGRPTMTKHKYRCKLLSEGKSENSEDTPGLVPPAESTDWDDRYYERSYFKHKDGRKLSQAESICVRLPHCTQYFDHKKFPSSIFTRIEVESMLRALFFIISRGSCRDGPELEFKELFPTGGVAVRDPSRVITWLSNKYALNLERDDDQFPKVVRPPGCKRMLAGEIFSDSVIFGTTESYAMVVDTALQRTVAVNTIRKQWSESLKTKNKFIFPVCVPLTTNLGDRRQAWVLIFVKSQTKETKEQICCEIIDFGGVSKVQIDAIGANLKKSFNKLFPKKKKGWHFFKHSLVRRFWMDDFLDGPRLVFTVALAISSGISNYDREVGKILFDKNSSAALGHFTRALIIESVVYKKKFGHLPFDEIESSFCPQKEKEIGFEYNLHSKSFDHEKFQKPILPSLRKLFK